MPLSDEERRKAAGMFFREEFKRSGNTAVVERDGTYAALDEIDQWFTANLGSLVSAVSSSWKNEFPAGPGRAEALNKLIAAWAMTKAGLVRG